MTLYEQWQEKLGDNEDTKGFMENYYESEAVLYKKLLEDKKFTIEGKYSDLVQEMGMDEVTFMAFLDGINTSLAVELKLDDIDAESELKIEIVPETLYYNMLVAKANWLYSLKEWDEILSEEERRDIRLQYNQDNRAVSEKIGRNDPCPCGSGKKYKKCCGMN